MKSKKVKKKLGKMSLNVRLTMALLSLFFVVVIGKLVYVNASNVVDGTNLSEFVKQRNTQNETLYATRGSIFDMYGEEYAKNTNSYTLIAFLSASRTTNPEKPNHVVDKERTARELAPLLNMSESSILERLNDNKYQVELGASAKNLGEDVKKKIESLELPGISFTESQKRSYKNKNYASYILGYARKDGNGELKGYMGIEEYFNEQLTGTNGIRVYQKDAFGYQIPNTEVRETPAESGNDIYLSINNDIQLILENMLDNLAKKGKLEWATFSIMNAKTGALIGSATIPNFNPNTLEDIESYINPLTSYQYEPGSTMKIFSYLAAMEEGKYNGKENFQSGVMTLKDGTTVKDFNNVGWGSINYDLGFAYSSNVGAANLGLKVETSKLKEYYERFGFGKKTGITLPAESSGTVAFKYESELANASFGQGMTITPIQMLQALSAFCNDGTMVKPYIVDRIINGNGETVYKSEVEKLNTIASKENIDKVKQLMYDVVYNGFPYNKAYAPSNMQIAGKTGTAEIPSSKGGYLTGKDDYIKSFGGIFPYEDPECVFYFAVKQYKSTADKATADITSTIATTLTEVAKNLGLVENEDAVDTSRIITLDNYLSTKTEETVTALNAVGIETITLGTGTKIVNQYPLQGTTTVAGNKVFLITNKADFKMPNVIGWTANEITTLAQLLGLDYEISLYGNVKSINYEVGEVIDGTKKLIIELTE